MTIDIEKLANEILAKIHPYNTWVGALNDLELFAESYAAKALEDKEREIKELKAELNKQLKIKKQMRVAVVQIVDAIAEYFGTRNPVVVKLLEQFKELR